jgi:hypothetical protein
VKSALAWRCDWWSERRVACTVALRVLVPEGEPKSRSRFQWMKMECARHDRRDERMITAR